MSKLMFELITQNLTEPFKYQFDLLRKRSFVERRKRSLLERIHKADEVFQQRLGDLVAEPLETYMLVPYNSCEWFRVVGILVDPS